MRIFLLTMDSNCFNAKTQKDYPEVEQLKTWQDNGWIDLIKTDVLERESENCYGQHLRNLRDKTKNLSLDYGATMPDIGILEQIYTAILFSGMSWEKEGNRFDAQHLACHVMNGRDYFLTEDGHFLDKKDELEKRYGVKVRTPRDCINEIEGLWRKEGTFPPEILTNPKIIAGTCIFEQFLPRTAEGDIIFEASKWHDNWFILRGTLYSPEGEELISFSEKPSIRNERASLFSYQFEPYSKNKIILDKEKYACVVAEYREKLPFSFELNFRTDLPGNDILENLRPKFRNSGVKLSESDRNGMFRLEKGKLQGTVWGVENKAIQTYVLMEKGSKLDVYRTRKVFEARVLNRGHLLLWGEFSDEEGKVKVSVNKEELILSGGGFI